MVEKFYVHSKLVWSQRSLFELDMVTRLWNAVLYAFINFVANLFKVSLPEILIQKMYIFFSSRNPKIVKSIVFVALAGSMIWTIIVGFTTSLQLSFDVMYHTATDIYINPLVRIMPYLLGVVTGWMLVEQRANFDVSPKIESCFWNVVVVVFVCTFFSTLKRDISILSTIIWIVFGRFCFSLAICCLIIGSATGKSIWWSKILEHKLFQHLNRLSYAVYLLNPFVISFVLSLSNSTTHADPLILVTFLKCILWFNYKFKFFF